MLQRSLEQESDMMVLVTVCRKGGRRERQSGGGGLGGGPWGSDLGWWPCVGGRPVGDEDEHALGFWLGQLGGW